jgi:hypothetical protein
VQHWQKVKEKQEEDRWISAEGIPHAALSMKDEHQANQRGRNLNRIRAHLLSTTRKTISLL